MPGNWRIFKLTEPTRRCVLVGRAGGEAGRERRRIDTGEKSNKEGDEVARVGNEKVRRTKFLRFM